MLKSVLSHPSAFSNAFNPRTAIPGHVRPRLPRYTAPRRAKVAPRCNYATVSTSSESSGGVRVGTLFLALSILGIGATSVGLYDYYRSYNTWPEEIRTDLRSAMRCKASQDYVSAHKFFQQVWEKATNLEVASKLGVLKVSGLGIAWAEMLEEAGRRADEGSVPNASGEAYGVLTETYNWTRDNITADGAVVTEKMRAIQIAKKLSEMAEGQSELDGQTEEQLTWAVEELLRLSASGIPDRSGKADQSVLVGELDLPPWVGKNDLGATLEALGNFYAGKRNVEYAMPLYLQSISLLLPPPKADKPEPGSADKCHAATIMNNLSSLIASAPRAPSKDIGQVEQASAWANKAAGISGAVLRQASEVDAGSDDCKPVLTVALYNLGMLKLLDGDKEGAKKYLNEAKLRAKQFDLKDAEVRAHETLLSI